MLRKQPHVSPGVPWKNLEKLEEDRSHVLRHSGLREARPPLQTASRRKSREAVRAGDSELQGELVAAIADARSSPVDLRNRLESTGALEMRKASILGTHQYEAQGCNSRPFEMIQVLQRACANLCRPAI